MSDLSPAGLEIFPATQSRQSLIESLLHAIGQPLSSLQMCILMRDRSPSSVLPPTLLGDVADQVSTLTRLFCSLRELLALTGPVPRIAAADLLAFLAASRLRWQRAGQAQQLHVAIDPQLRAGEGGRFRHATLPWQQRLDELMETAFLSTPPNETVTLCVQTSSASGLLVRLEGGMLLSENSHAARFTLPVAALLLQAPGQSLTYSLRPFAAALSLRPPSPPDSPASDIARPEGDA